jgi:UDP-GlcNAc3NAcA epimerase
VVTIHRPRNTVDREALELVFDYVAACSPDHPVILPLHPRTKAAAARFDVTLAHGTVKIIEPVGYLDMCALFHGSRLVLTDS